MPRFILFGSGSSMGVPPLHCSNCYICKKTNRTNVSALIQFDDQNKNILIDPTHHIHQNLLSYFKIFNGDIINNPRILITHTHHDAFHGIQTYLNTHDGIGNIYCCQKEFEIIKREFPLLKNIIHFPIKFNNNLLNIDNIKNNNSLNIIDENINNIKNINFSNNISLFDDIKIIPRLVSHGNVKCLGFIIEDKIGYFSDISSIEELFDLINLEILFIDCVSINNKVESHLNYLKVKELVKIIKPKRTILIGCSHLIPDDMKLEPRMEMGYDNLYIDF